MRSLPPSPDQATNQFAPAGDWAEAEAAQDSRFGTPSFEGPGGSSHNRFAVEETAPYLYPAVLPNRDKKSKRKRRRR